MRKSSVKYLKRSNMALTTTTTIVTYLHNTYIRANEQDQLNITGRIVLSGLEERKKDKGIRDHVGSS